MQLGWVWRVSWEAAGSAQGMAQSKRGIGLQGGCMQGVVCVWKEAAEGVWLAGEWDTTLIDRQNSDARKRGQPAALFAAAKGLLLRSGRELLRGERTGTLGVTR